MDIRSYLSLAFVALAIASTITVCSGSREQFDFSSEEKAAIVERHNFLRRTPLAKTDEDRNAPDAPKAAGMEILTWNDELANMAYILATGCAFKHGQPANTSPYSHPGQNLAYQGGSVDSPYSGVVATNRWYREVNYHTYDPNGSGECQDGKMCGHYTEVVWNTDRQVGCGRYYCPADSGAYLTSAWYIVCNYGPGGNIVGRPPFQLGTPCSACSSGTHVQCNDGLCEWCTEPSDTCACRNECQNCGVLDPQTCECTCPNGFFGKSCEKECVKLHSSCDDLGAYCDSYPLVKRICPGVCGLCNYKDPGFTCNA